MRLLKLGEQSEVGKETCSRLHFLSHNRKHTVRYRKLDMKVLVGLRKEPPHYNRKTVSQVYLELFAFGYFCLCGARCITMETANFLRRALENKSQPALGAWLSIPNAEVTRTIANTPGLSWITIDAEHGGFDDRNMHVAVHQIYPRGVSPIVRLPGDENFLIKRALDCGAHGVIIPMCNTAEQAKEIVRKCKYPPLGNRGFGSPFMTSAFNNIDRLQYLNNANKTLTTIVQIETREAIENIESIAAVEGIDVLFIGPFDLSISLGCLPSGDGGATWPDETMRAIEKVLAVAKRHNKWTGIFAYNGNNAKFWIEKGFNMVNTCTDIGILSNGAKKEIAEAH